VAWQPSFWGQKARSQWKWDARWLSLSRKAGDFRYPEKILYAFEIRIQRWLYLCKQQEDRLTINNSIIDMDQVIEQILNSSLSIDLPLVFTTGDAQKKEGVILTPAGAGEQQQGGEKKGKKRKGGG
jgi:hypothetical protein